MQLRNKSIIKAMESWRSSRQRRSGSSVVCAGAVGGVRRAACGQAVGGEQGLIRDVTATLQRGERSQVVGYVQMSLQQGHMREIMCAPTATVQPAASVGKITCMRRYCCTMLGNAREPGARAGDERAPQSVHTRKQSEAVTSDRIKKGWAARDGADGRPPRRPPNGRALLSRYVGYPALSCPAFVS